jgi:hypothetical protein
MAAKEILTQHLTPLIAAATVHAVAHLPLLVPLLCGLAVYDTPSEGLRHYAVCGLHALTSHCWPRMHAGYVRDVFRVLVSVYADLAPPDVAAAAPSAPAGAAGCAHAGIGADGQAQTGKRRGHGNSKKGTSASGSRAYNTSALAQESLSKIVEVCQMLYALEPDVVSSVSNQYRGYGFTPAAGAGTELADWDSPAVGHLMGLVLAPMQ